MKMALMTKKKLRINFEAWIQLKFHLMLIKSFREFSSRPGQASGCRASLSLFIFPVNDALEVISFLASVKSFSVTYVHICTQPLRYFPLVSLEDHKEACSA